jgi:hypothetical protein
MKAEEFPRSFFLRFLWNECEEIEKTGPANWSWFFVAPSILCPTKTGHLGDIRMPRNIAFFTTAARRGAAEQAIFGHAIPDNDYADAIGDITNDALVEVRNFVITSKGNFAIEIRAKSSLFSSTVVRINPNYFEYDDLMLINKNQGTGPLILKLVAETAQRLTFNASQAEGRKYTNPQNPQTDCYGHYVYPKLGFECDIPADAPARPAALAHITRLRDLVDDPVGRRFWRASGVTVPHIEFDLTPGSVSWQRLFAALPAPPTPPIPAATAPPAPAAVSAPAAAPPQGNAVP